MANLTSPIAWPIIRPQNAPWKGTQLIKDYRVDISKGSLTFRRHVRIWEWFIYERHCQLNYYIMTNGVVRTSLRSLAHGPFWLRQWLTQTSNNLTISLLMVVSAQKHQCFWWKLTTVRIRYRTVWWIVFFIRNYYLNRSQVWRILTIPFLWEWMLGETV